jgi:hypothetical protein
MRQRLFGRPCQRRGSRPLSSCKIEPPRHDPVNIRFSFLRFRTTSEIWYCSIWTVIVASSSYTRLLCTCTLYSISNYIKMHLYKHHETCSVLPPTRPKSNQVSETNPPRQGLVHRKLFGSCVEAAAASLALPLADHSWRSHTLVWSATPPALCEP